ncbi:unnamed protein product [Knipowitschia caucasica]
MMDILSFLFCSLLFWINIARAENVCSRPELGDLVQVKDLQRYFSAGVVLALSCAPGHTPYNGPRTIVCTNTGQWTKTKFTCKPVECSSPDAPVNGQMHYEDLLYQSVVNFTCDDGYILTGASSASCLIDGSWSVQEPQCKPVSCGPAPIPEFGMIIYDKIIRGNNIYYGTSGTYKCLAPLALFGEERAECRANGQWTETPQCQEVSCSPPENIENGVMSIPQKRDFEYTETIKYGCNGDYVLHGPLQIVCEKTGQWSEKPSCKAPCSVGIQFGRIMYKGKTLWMEDFKPNIVLHGETVSVYCLDKDRNCEYAFPTNCFDGLLSVPECFEEPSRSQVSSSNPTEMSQC